MFVSMVRIRHMAVGVPQRLVDVPMAVWSSGHHIMGMRVMSIVVRVSVLMIQLIVLMLVPVRLREVKSHAQHHEYAAHGHDPCSASVTQRDRERCADEWRERKNGSGARRAERALRQ